MALAVLSIDIEAKMARFEADMTRATRSLDKLANNARNSFASVGDVFAGSFLASAAEESIRGLVQLFPKLIEGVGAFQDLSEMTGASAEALASFQTAADVSGVSVADLAGLMNRLTGNLSKLTDEGKGAGAGLKALGLNLAAFRTLTPDEQIKTLAQTFDKFADGSGKTAVALSLFGKQGAQVLKFFKEYQSKGGAVVRLTAEQIAAADNYADAHARMLSNIKQSAQVIAVQALPAIDALSKGFLDGTSKLLGFKSATGELKVDSGILDFAESGALAVATLGESLVGLVKLARAVGGSFQAVGADIALPFQVAAAGAGVLQGRTINEAASDVVQAILNRNKVVADANQRYVDLWTYDGTAVTTEIRKSFAAQRALISAKPKPPPDDNKPSLSLTLPDADAKKADDQFARFMAQITERKTLAAAELSTNQKLNDSDKFRISILAKLDEAQLDPQRVGRIKAALAEAVAIMRQVDAQQELTKARAAAEAIEQRQLSGMQKEVDARISSNESLRNQVEEIGLSADQMDRLVIARLENKAALEAEALGMLVLAEASAAQIATTEQSLTLLRQEIELRRNGQTKAAALAGNASAGASTALDEYLKKVTEAGVATRQAVGQSVSLLEDDLTAGLASGSLTVSRTVDFMISEFLRLAVVRPLLKSIFSGVSGGGAAGLLGSLFGAANGAAFAPGGVVPFAQGGIFNSPHLFQFGQGGSLATGVLGEAGPEAVMPLARGANGKLGVRAQGMGGGGVTINQVFNFAAGNNRNELAAWGQGIKQQTLMAVAEAQKRDFGRGNN